jgi:hypothetical protein
MFRNIKKHRTSLDNWKKNIKIDPAQLGPQEGIRKVAAAFFDECTGSWSFSKQQLQFSASSKTMLVQRSSGQCCQTFYISQSLLKTVNDGIIDDIILYYNISEAWTMLNNLMWNKKDERNDSEIESLGSTGMTHTAIFGKGIQLLRAGCGVPWSKMG